MHSAAVCIQCSRHEQFFASVCDFFLLFFVIYLILLLQRDSQPRLIFMRVLFIFFISVFFSLSLRSVVAYVLAATVDNSLFASMQFVESMIVCFVSNLSYLVDWMCFFWTNGKLKRKKNKIEIKTFVIVVAFVENVCRVVNTAAVYYCKLSTHATIHFPRRHQISDIVIIVCVEFLRVIRFSRDFFCSALTILCSLLPITINNYSKSIFDFALLPFIHDFFLSSMISQQSPSLRALGFLYDLCLTKSKLKKILFSSSFTDYLNGGKPQ